MIRIAVDAMGGDTAPQAEIAGALQALKSLPDGFLIQLVGRSEVINSELAEISRRRPQPPRSPRGG